MRPKGLGRSCRGCASSGAKRAGASNGADATVDKRPADVARHGQATPCVARMASLASRLKTGGAGQKYVDWIVDSEQE